MGLSKLLFRTLLEIATLNSFFIFDGNLYKQCEGLGISVCLSLLRSLTCFFSSS